MKSFTVAAAAFALVAPAFAAPAPFLGLDLNLNLFNNGKGRNSGPFQFTSTYDVVADPTQVVSATNAPTGGQAGASGLFSYGINSVEDIICWNITVFISSTYQSAAKTSTHIHQGAKGAAGPPRITFPNPEIVGDTSVQGRRTTIGCQKGPFTTGVPANGVPGTDSGNGFTLKMIEDDPSNFFTDVHTANAVPGAIRGQLSAKKQK